jgi:hypothetical protein
LYIYILYYIFLKIFKNYTVEANFLYLLRVDPLAGEAIAFHHINIPVRGCSRGAWQAGAFYKVHNHHQLKRNKLPLAFKLVLRPWRGLFFLKGEPRTTLPNPQIRTLPNPTPQFFIWGLGYGPSAQPIFLIWGAPK